VNGLAFRGANELVFTAQPVTVRPCHFETPRSYLGRQCQVNVIDRHLIDAAIQQRRVVTGRRHQLAEVIHELGGPPAGHFARSYLRATCKTPADAEALLTDTYRKHANDIRYACTRCTAGQVVETFNHWQFMICLRHGRWLAPDRPAHHQLQLPAGAQWVAAERRYRHAAATRFLTRRLADTTWRAVRDQAAVLGPTEWADRLRAAQDRPDFRPGVHDRLALFPHNTKVLQLIAGPQTWNAVDALCRSPEHLRGHLRRQLDRIPGHKWVLVEALTEELIRSRRSRLAELDALLSRHLPPPPLDD